MHRASLAQAIIVASTCVAWLATPPLTWTAGPALPVARDHHVVFMTHGTAGDFLHTIGGNTYRETLADGWRIQIREDGGFGPWQPIDSLPASRAGHSVVVTERSVVVVGGKLADRSNTGETLVAALRGDGSLGPWTAGPAMPGPRFHHSAAFHSGVVYVTGGLEASVSVATVFRARVRPDGSLDAWTRESDMPRPRSHHASFVHRGALYLVAGLDGNPAGANTPLKDVLRAPIQSDGSLGAWVTVSALDSAYATHAAVVDGGYLYVVGGVENNARFVGTVQRASIADDGTIGPWEAVTPGLPVARGHVHQVPLWRGRLYSLGGSANRQVMSALHVGTLAP
jgi:N-acetylneuraminic acid mutarotase